MPNSVHLAVDLGASSGRVVAGVCSGTDLRLHELHRFPNSAKQFGNLLCWNIQMLWDEIQIGLQKASAEFGHAARSIGVDTWGVDFVLLDKNQDLIFPAVCHRDPRTVDSFEAALNRLGRDAIFSETGLQFMPINSIYQLYSMRLRDSPSLDSAAHFLMIPDLFHWLLTGELSNEFTNASTTQLLQPGDAGWSTRLMEALEIPNIFHPTIQPGTSLGELSPVVQTNSGLSRIPVIVPATHDTGSAVLGVPAGQFAEARPNWCYISCGTWSLMGIESTESRVNALCLKHNFSHEGGAENTIRLLKNIGGLWPLQQMAEEWKVNGTFHDWSTLFAKAAKIPALQVSFDPDHPELLSPGEMVQRVTGLLQKQTDNFDTSPSSLARIALESLALRYRYCLQSLQELIGYELETIHIVGGGSQNELLCQLTANACSRRVIAGPVEATAIGNIAAQLVGVGELSNFAEARQLIRASQQIQVYDPDYQSVSKDRWDLEYASFCSNLTHMIKE